MTIAWRPPEVFGSLQPESATGMLPAFYPDVPSLEASTSIHIGSGQSVAANLTAHAATFYRVALPIANLDPSRGVSTTLIPESSGFSIDFNSNSQQIVGYLPSGSYTLRIVTFGPTPFTYVAHLQVSGASAHSAAITATTSADIPIVVRSEFTANLANQLNQRGGSPDLSLQPVDSSGNVGFSSTRPDDGDNGLRFQNVSEGRYRVNVFAPMGYVASATSGVIDLLQEPLTVGPGAAATPIEITLRNDFATLTGHILVDGTQQAQRTNPEEVVYLRCLPLDRPQMQPVAGISLGRQLTMTNVPPGRYLVVASKGPMQEIEYRNEEVLRDLLGKGVVVTLAADQKLEVQVPLMPDEVNE